MMYHTCQEKLKKYIESSKNVLSQESMDAVKYYYEHGEYEMAFEGLLIELISINQYPDDFVFDDWLMLGIYYGLNKESVFQENIWEEFIAWGSKC